MLIKSKSKTERLIRLFKILFLPAACFLFISADAQVKADFATTVPATCAPVVVQFTDSTKGNPTAWIWDFGNGDTSHRQNPKAIYTAAGTYNVTLTASNNGSSNFITKTISIIGSVAAGFTYQYDNVCAAPSQFSFTAKDEGDTILYAWNFGNGKTTSGKTSATVFNAEGSYNVRLVTTTPQGCHDTAYQAFAIGSATAGFSSYSVVCKNAPVVFTDTSYPLPLSRTWYINGASAGNGSTLTHTFAGTGSYTIKLVAGFGTCTKTAEKTIMVKDKPVAGFSESGSLQSCTVPAMIRFTNTSTNADTYKWVFGDGNTNNKTSPDYSYTINGSFSPALIAFNGDGCSDTLTKNNLVRLGPPVISSFTALPKRGCIPETVASDANITSPDPVATYEWNDGDNGAPVTGSHFTHTYTNDAYYNVTLTVTTKNGCTGSYTLNQAVAAGTKPVTDFTVNQSAVCASKAVNFIDKSIGKVTSWNYNFGDGLSATVQNPSHLFTKIGSNDVTLYTSNKGCNGDPKTIKNIVTILPPIGGFSYNYTCANQLAVQFTDQSQQPLSWQWIFGDGQTSLAQSPLHTYTASGNYEVILTATNGKCSSSDTMTIAVTNDKPTIVTEPSKPFICRNDSIKLSAVSNTGFVSGYSWNVGDGTAVVNDSTVTHIYTKSNDYKPYVAVQYINKCRDTIYTGEPVHVYGPTAAFSVSQTGNCLPPDVTFTDKSTTDKLHTIDTKQWYYGNGETEVVNGTTHVHTYTTGGSFTPKLIVTDAVGCVDSIMATQAIIAKGAVAFFTYAINAACDSAVVSFTNTSVASNDVIASYSWDFGDANHTISSRPNPSYAYYKAGAYKVRLTVTTQSGCSAVYEPTITVSISPKQTVTITSPDVACVASDIALSATLSGNDSVSAWTWTLGNGTTKNGQTINAIYNKPGTYNITAIATTAGGCSDTAYKPITISDVPPTNAGADSYVCAGSSILLQASGAGSYTWQQVNNDLSCSACASPSARPDAATHYVVTGKNAAGCTSNDTVFIDVQNKEIIAVAKDAFAICEGDQIQLSASGADSYSWQPVDGLSNALIANPGASPTEDINYIVSGEDSRHCFTDSKTITVSVDAAPKFNIVDSVLTLSRGSKRILTTTNSADVVRWLWQPATGLSCSTCPQPELTAAISGIYTAVAYTTNGCHDSDEVKILLLCDQSGIFLPMAFTPNGDGKNDRFYAKSFADSKIVSFIIISRNGEVVYRRNNILTNTSKDGWDGFYNGQPLSSGTYIYRLEVLCEKAIIPFTGTVTLIR